MRRKDKMGWIIAIVAIAATIAAAVATAIVYFEKSEKTMKIWITIWTVLFNSCY